MKEFILQQANSNDIPALVALEKICFTSDCLTAKHFTYLLKQSSAMIVTLHHSESRRLIGSAILLFRKNTTLARLYSIAIHPDYRHKQLGQLLYHFLEEMIQTRKCTEIRLEVKTDNHAAIAFYLKNGFTVFKKTEHYYEDGADALRMRKLTTPHEIETS